MESMIFAIQAVLMVALLGVSLLVFLMVRQVGVISWRMGEETTPVAPGLETGTILPLQKFSKLGGTGEIAIPFGGEGTSFVLFLSFSCPVCSLVMEGLDLLPEGVVRKLGVFLLDGNPQVGYPEEVERLQNMSLSLVEGYELAGQFKIRKAPHLYVVEADGTITATELLFSFEELVDVIRKFIPVELKNRGTSHVQQART